MKTLIIYGLTQKFVSNCIIFLRCFCWTVLVGTKLLSLNSIYAQDGKIYDENILIDSYFNNLYNFSFNHSVSLILELSKSNIDRATLFNIKANLAWWKLLSGDSANLNLNKCNFNTDESIKFNLKNKQRDKGFLLNIIYSYSLRARLEGYNGNSLKSFLYFYKSSLKTILQEFVFLNHYSHKKEYLVSLNLQHKKITDS